MGKRSITNSVLWRANVFVSILLWIGWLSYYLPPKSATTLSIVSFVVPLLLILHFLYLLFWTAKRKKRALLSFLCLTFSFLIFGTLYRFTLLGSGTAEADGFSVMSYNVRGLNSYQQLPIKNVDSAIFDFVIKESPDFFCVQESHYSMKLKGSLDGIYPYKFVDFIYGVPATSVINSFYSKYPILNCEVINFPNSDNGALFADIIIKKDTVRMYNLHLQSFSVIPDVEHLQNEASGKLLKRIMRGLRMQEEQASIISEHFENSPYPVVVVGDFNNTQFSKVYKILKADFSDSFLETGASFGKTFEMFTLPMRIDYILADQDFEIISHTNYDIELSDHYPIMAKMVLRSNK